MEKKERKLRSEIRKGLRILGRDAVTLAALLTLGPRRTTTRITSACGCFVGTIVTGNATDDEVEETRSVDFRMDDVDEMDSTRVTRAVEDAKDGIEAIFWAHNTGRNLILEQEVEKYLGYSIAELQATVVL